MRRIRGAGDGHLHVENQQQSYIAHEVKMMNLENHKPPLILGIGNLLMGDEGVGVHAIRALVRTDSFGEHEALPQNVKLLDGGTGGFHLLSLFQEYDPIILIDATMDGKPAGTVSLIHPKFASDFPKTLSAHDIGLRDLLESAQLLGPLPKLHLITISIAEIQSMTLSLSAEVEKALPFALSKVKELLEPTHPPMTTVATGAEVSHFLQNGD